MNLGKSSQAISLQSKTPYRVFRRFKEGVGAKRKSGSGRPAVKLPPKQANKMIKEILSKVGVSQTIMVKKYRVQRTLFGKVLKKSKVDWIKTLKEE